MLALDGGIDGLTVLRKILAGAPERLLPEGHVFVEIAFDQAKQALAVATEITGLSGARILKDHAGNDRVLTARRT